MSDDLVDRLRSEAAFAAPFRSIQLTQAADEIAALQARVAELEAKLAKAVVLLGQWRLASAGHVSVQSVIDKHDATLAELTGQDDDAN